MHARLVVLLALAATASATLFSDDAATAAAPACTVIVTSPGRGHVMAVDDTVVVEFEASRGCEDDAFFVVSGMPPGTLVVAASPSLVRPTLEGTHTVVVALMARRTHPSGVRYPVTIAANWTLFHVLPPRRPTAPAVDVLSALPPPLRDSYVGPPRGGEGAPPPSPCSVCPPAGLRLLWLGSTAGHDGLKQWAVDHLAHLSTSCGVSVTYLDASGVYPPSADDRLPRDAVSTALIAAGITVARVTVRCPYAALPPGARAKLAQLTHGAGKDAAMAVACSYAMNSELVAAVGGGDPAVRWDQRVTPGLRDAVAPLVALMAPHDVAVMTHGDMHGNGDSVLWLLGVARAANPGIRRLVSLGRGNTIEPHAAAHIRSHADALVSLSAGTLLRPDVLELVSGPQPLRSFVVHPVVPHAAPHAPFSATPAVQAVQAAARSCGDMPVLVIGSVGRLVGGKGPGFFVDMAAALEARHGHEVCLVYYMAGGGGLPELEGPLKAYAVDHHRLAPHRLLLLGHVPRAELPALFAATDIAVNPTVMHGETFNIATVELMAAGVPTATFCTHGMVDYCRYTVVASEHSGDALAQAAASLFDPHARRRTAHAAKEFVEEHFVRRNANLQRALTGDSGVCLAGG